MSGPAQPRGESASGRDGSDLSPPVRIVRQTNEIAGDLPIPKQQQRQQQLQHMQERAVSRQAAKVAARHDRGDDDGPCLPPPSIESEAVTATPSEPVSATSAEPSGTETFHMYLQAEIMAKSTGLGNMNGQLTKLQQEINERQAAMNELKSKMIHTQGSIAMLHGMTAKMRDLKLVTDPAEAGV